MLRRRSQIPSEDLLTRGSAALGRQDCLKGSCRSRRSWVRHNVVNVDPAARPQAVEAAESREPPVTGRHVLPATVPAPPRKRASAFGPAFVGLFFYLRPV